MNDASHPWRTARRAALCIATAGAAALGLACGSTKVDERASRIQSELTVAAKMPRYALIRDSARARGIENAYLLAGIANTETGLAHCWSEATWACQGPSSPDCGGGPVIAGSADGPCSIRQGGLGMFQFDAGTFDDTLNRYGAHVLTIDGQMDAAIDFVVNMLVRSAYTTNTETDANARAWINAFDVHNPTLEDQWIRTVLRYYNGCQPSWSCWSPRIQTYTDGLMAAVNDPGLAFWAEGRGTRCGSSPYVVGAIDEKYQELGGCASFLGVPITEQLESPDGLGRYSVFEHGSIYWTAEVGAHEVHGEVREKWSQMGWEAGPLGYPTTDETATPDGIGRFNQFENGSMYWTEDGAFAVYGAIHDTWADSGWERGPLGYPTSDEYDVPEGRRSDFQLGYILFDDDTEETTIVLDSEGRGSGGTGAGGAGAGGSDSASGEAGETGIGGTAGASEAAGEDSMGGTAGAETEAVGGAAGQSTGDGEAGPTFARRDRGGGCQIVAAPAPSSPAFVLLGLPALVWARRSFGVHRRSTRRQAA